MMQSGATPNEYNYTKRSDVPVVANFLDGGPPYLLGSWLFYSVPNALPKLASANKLDID